METKPIEICGTGPNRPARKVTKEKLIALGAGDEVKRRLADPVVPFLERDALALLDEVREARRTTHQREWNAKQAALPIEVAEAAHTQSGEALVAKQVAEIEAKPKPVPAPKPVRPPMTPLEERLERERQLREMEKARDLRLAELQQRIDYWEEHRRFAERSARRMREVAANASCGLAVYGGEETMEQLLARQDRGYR